MAAEAGALSFDERMAMIEQILFELELSSRQAPTVDAAIDMFAFGVGKVVARLRLEVDVARESRDVYRNKRDQLREELTRKESLRSLPSSNESSSVLTPASTSTSQGGPDPVQYSALACQPELLDDDPPAPTSPRALAAPFRRSVASAQRASSPLSPRLQPAPAGAVPSKPSRANKAEIKHSPAPSAPAMTKILPTSSNNNSPAPPAKPTKAAKQDLLPRPARVAGHYQEFIPAAAGRGGTYVDLDLPKNTMEYGQFDEQQSEFGEFPQD